jgi:superfamily II DNA or RNA helicase
MRSASVKRHLRTSLQRYSILSVPRNVTVIQPNKIRTFSSHMMPNSLSDLMSNFAPNIISNYLPKERTLSRVPLGYIIGNRKTKISNFKPFQYQLEAERSFVEKFDKRGILAMPCGTGKTYISYLVSKHHQQIIILSPLKQHTKQNVEKFIEYGYPESKTLRVDSDGERDIRQIEKFIAKNDRGFLISATYDSVDIIRKALKLMDKPFIIVDEFHNLSKRNVVDKDDDFYNVLHSKEKMLFMSATPRVYELENEFNEVYTNEIFGPTIYRMPFTDAIKNKYITDYNIWLPLIHDHDDGEIKKEIRNENLEEEKLREELCIRSIDSVLKAKCEFLLLSLENTRSSKCIIYCVDTNEIKELVEAMTAVGKYDCSEYDISQITCNDSEISRKKILDNFSHSDKVQLLFSVRILDEGIDIPSCDSIFITYTTQNKLRTLQRLNRCTRIDKMNPDKIGNIFDYFYVFFLYLCFIDRSALFVWRIDFVTSLVVIYLSKLHRHHQVISLCGVTNTVKY